MNHLQFTNILWNLKRIIEDDRRPLAIRMVEAQLQVDNALELLRQERDQYLLADRPDPREKNGDVLFA